MRPLKSLLLSCACVLATLGLAAQDPSDELLKPAFQFGEVAPLPIDLRGFALGRSGGSILAAGGVDPFGQPQRAVYRYDGPEAGWSVVGRLDHEHAYSAFATSPAGLILIGGEVADEPATSVTRLSLEGDTLVTKNFAPLPTPVANPAAAILDGQLYVAGARAEGAQAGQPIFLRLAVSPRLDFLQRLLSGAGFSFTEENPQWVELPAWDGPALAATEFEASFESVHLFGLDPASGEPMGFGYHPVRGWRSLTAPPDWGPSTVFAALGESHIFAFEGTVAADGDPPRILTYHTLTDTWVEASPWADQAAEFARAVTVGGEIFVVSGNTGVVIEVLPPRNNYGLVDHTVVAIYLLAMVGMGAWFVRREKNTKDYFRASNRAPWWAIGMSLFATAASAISLMTMPGKSFATDWTFFAISVFSVICLPISLFLLAPLVRKLEISTANEYLELRFGLTARMVGSVIYMLNQILGRMAPVIFLPSIAMSAITGIDIWIWILVVGSVTTIYTFLGGLTAVIWTDTIQGLIMVGTVAGCLVLILFKLDMPFSEMWATLDEYDKLRTFDWSLSVTQPVVLMVFVGTIFITLLGIGDQNYVQRVQAAPSLRDAKKAVATQMGVAIPINLLLFGLGTALYLYYRTHPAELNPVMKTDGVYPLFAAQHLPVGVSGLVIAALLAASMSTISSAINSVANLGIDDFYRRFRRNTAEGDTMVLARVLSILVGVTGIVGALFLANSDSKSVWDAALIITGLITNGTVGLFGLGLLTKRAHELGALLGVAAGMVVTIWLQAFTPVTFWLYAVFGSIVTFVVGYTLSFIPFPRRVIDGLTVYTLDKPRPRL
ncbi:MAG: sodium:solute symporter family transporter [Opitutales bacterium]